MGERYLISEEYLRASIGQANENKIEELEIRGESTSVSPKLKGSQVAET
jgi:hypothetical protein